MGDPSLLLTEGEGETVGCAVVVGVASGVEFGLLVTGAEALGEVEATGLEEAAADGVALSNGFAVLASLSRTPARARIQAAGKTIAQSRATTASAGFACRRRSTVK